MRRHEKYIVLAGSRYYPVGGWRDMKMAFCHFDAAERAVEGLGNDYDWWQIVSLETFTIVAENPTPEQQ